MTVEPSILLVLSIQRSPAADAATAAQRQQLQRDAQLPGPLPPPPRRRRQAAPATGMHGYMTSWRSAGGQFN